MSGSGLGDFFKAVAEEKKKLEEAAKPKVDINSLDLNIKEAVSKMYSELENKEVEFEPQPEPIAEEVLFEEPEIEPPSLVETTLDILRGTNIPGNPDPLAPTDQQFVTLQDFNKHYNTFVERVQQQLSTIGGGGEVDFRYLDDVERSTMTPSNDNWVLEYDAASGHVKFTDSIGPISTITFDTASVDVSNTPGLVSWSNADQTLNIHHPGGPVQQVGQETYGFVRNKTGATITNGTAVRFAGAEQNGTARLLVAPFIANNSFPTLYGLGIATQDIPDGEDGRVTVWGKVRDVNTSAFNVGDILFVSPTDSGGLTNVRPTAPNNVIPMAAVLRSDSAQGEIFVRPSYEQQKNYADFGRDSDLAASIINTATPVPFTIAGAAQQIERKAGNNAAIVLKEAGFYNFTVNSQLLSTNSSSKTLTMWFKKNGVNVINSSRLATVAGSNEYRPITMTEEISCEAQDSIQVMFAVTDLNLVMKAVAATAYAPPSSSIQLSITQPAL